ncbi:selenocysteine-specific translation elongation factor [Fodinicola acaciae]|uniref:selenocysteine-specific translation elongation factor n=1 Tax=Fodinicola acaciae TaxID=2681555 RepID=UPI0013CF463F|nr:selenocysteine-specific translation elongation factor [Fodinicola acaciae]
MQVIATAGHVDHGKSTLVRALTGMEPDRWDEERRRGLTIGLGFAWTELDGAEIAFVDVPGHEKFVPTMLAGVGPVPAAMIVVAADAGWMPQSAEHLAALDALGVHSGLLVVSRADLADPEPARRQATEIIARTSLRQVSSVAVSAVTGAGLDDLRSAISALVKALPPADADADVRLWIDRSFTLRGAGTVVTGTLAAGRLHAGDELVIASTGQPVKIRGLHALGRARDEVAATARVAVNLRGVERHQVPAGDALVSPDAWLVNEVVEVAVATDGLPARLMLHIGSAAVPVRVRTLGKHAARLTLARGLPLRYGDRVLLREPGRHQIAAGATVVALAPPPLRRRGAAAARADHLASARSPEAASLLAIRDRGFVTPADLRRAGLPPAGENIAGWQADPDRLAELAGRMPRLLSAWQTENPLSAGMPADALRHRLALPDRDILAALVDRAGLRLGHGVVTSPTNPGNALPAAISAAVAQLRDHLLTSPFDAPDGQRLADLGLGPAQLAAAARTGQLLRLTGGVVLLPDAPREAVRLLAKLPQPFTMSAARQALGTSRRVAMPLLEFLDRHGSTERLLDDRRRVRQVDLDDS